MCVLPDLRDPRPRPGSRDTARCEELLQSRPVTASEESRPVSGRTMELESISRSPTPDSLIAMPGERALTYNKELLQYRPVTASEESRPVSGRTMELESISRSPTPDSLIAMPGERALTESPRSTVSSVPTPLTSPRSFTATSTDSSASPAMPPTPQPPRPRTSRSARDSPVAACIPKPKPNAPKPRRRQAAVPTENDEAKVTPERVEREEVERPTTSLCRREGNWVPAKGWLSEKIQQAKRFATVADVDSDRVVSFYRTESDLVETNAGWIDADQEAKPSSAEEKTSSPSGRDEARKPEDRETAVLCAEEQCAEKQDKEGKDGKHSLRKTTSKIVDMWYQKHQKEMKAEVRKADVEDIYDFSGITANDWSPYEAAAVGASDKNTSSTLPDRDVHQDAPEEPEVVPTSDEVEEPIVEPVQRFTYSSSSDEVEEVIVEPIERFTISPESDEEDRDNNIHQKAPALQIIDSWYKKHEEKMVATLREFDEDDIYNFDGITANDCHPFEAAVAINKNTSPILPERDVDQQAPASKSVDTWYKKHDEDKMTTVLHDEDDVEDIYDFSGISANDYHPFGVDVPVDKNTSPILPERDVPQTDRKHSLRKTTSKIVDTWYKKREAKMNAALHKAEVEDVYDFSGISASDCHPFGVVDATDKNTSPILVNKRNAALHEADVEDIYDFSGISVNDWSPYEAAAVSASDKNTSSTLPDRDVHQNAPEEPEVIVPTSDEVEQPVVQPASDEVVQIEYLQNFGAVEDDSDSENDIFSVPVLRYNPSPKSWSEIGVYDDSGSDSLSDSEWILPPRSTIKSRRPKAARPRPNRRDPAARD